MTLKHFGLTALLLLLGAAQASPLPDKPHVYVEGSAWIEVVPDRITFSVVIEETADDVASAKTSVDDRSRTLIELCSNLGIKDKSISTTTLRISPSSTYEDGEWIRTGTSVSRRINIELNKLELYPAVIEALVRAHISEIIQTKFSVSDDKERSDEALVAAMADARLRAERLASSQGRKLGDAFSISEFMTRGEERYMLAVSRRVQGDSARNTYAMADVSSPVLHEPFEPGVMVATAQVFVVYLLR